jgi:outer membrane protein N
MALPGNRQKVSLSICVLALSLLWANARGAEEPQVVTAEPSGASQAVSSESAELADEKTVDAPDSEVTEAEHRELGSDEDPMAAEEARRDAKREEESDEEEKQQSGFDIYGSVRIRYREQDNIDEFQDSSSRIGANVELRVLRESFVYARYEAGFNVLTGLEGLVNPGEKAGEQFSETVFTRLAYVGVDTPHVNYIFGKNWSTYYKVSYFTDRFMGTGGSASGTYNAQTDGGPTGPGRADKTLQTQFSINFLPARWFKPFELNAQLQHGNSIPFGEGADYGTAYSLSAILTTRRNHTLGLAHNYAQIDLSDNPSLRRIGLSGNANATLVGLRSFGDRWYAGFVASRLQNHETTDDGIYFNGWGSELYAQYRIADKVWFVGGFNALEPDADQLLARDYRVRYAVAGFRYSFDEFRRMIFVNFRIDDSLNADGRPGSDVFTIGIRWDLSKRGWHRPH